MNIFGKNSDISQLINNVLHTINIDVCATNSYQNVAMHILVRNMVWNSDQNYKSILSFKSVI